jgi:putative transcriptional regulator
VATNSTKKGLVFQRGVTELADKVGIKMANISVLKNGKAKAIRLSTLEAICRALECRPGDILEYRSSDTASLTPMISKLSKRSSFVVLNEIQAFYRREETIHLEVS